MVIDFSSIDLRDRPQFILENLDETAIGYLGAILSPTAKFNYNEVSEISFEYPSQVDGVELPEYELLTSMRVINVRGYGRFLLKDPKENDNGIIKKKSCTAYSLEIELGNKTITLAEGVYKLYGSSGNGNPSVMDVILEKFPSWSIGEVDPDLYDVYRYFSVDDATAYNLMKTDLQEKYSCIFDFDTYNRRINIRSVDSVVSTKQVYLSKRNLIKEIDIEEDTENLVTALDVYGADGVNIRDVNPLGTNTIYNLDHFMNTTFFPQTIIDKWQTWKQTIDDLQEPFFFTTMQRLSRISEQTVAEAELADLNGELSSLENQQAILIQNIAQVDPTLTTPDTEDPTQEILVIDQLKDNLDDIIEQIRLKKIEISSKENEISMIEASVETFTEQLRNIISQAAFKNDPEDENPDPNKFTDEEFEILDRYFKGGTLSDESFVLSSIQNYASANETAKNVYSTMHLTNLADFGVSDLTESLHFWNFRGGELVLTWKESSSSELILGRIDADIIRGTYEIDSTSSKFTASMYLAKGSAGDLEFDSATLTVSGMIGSTYIDSLNAFNQTSSVLLIPESSVSLSLANSFYQKYSVEQELYEYGEENLAKLSTPTYYFSIDSADFFALDEFELFAKQFELGEKVYLHLDDRVLQPIATGAEFNFDDPSSLKLSFGDSFNLNDASFKLEKLLDKSVSMGSALSVNQYKYSDFVTSGADNAVENFMTSAISAMKNNILSGDNNEVTIDNTGIRLRNYENGSYAPEQVWINNNALMFTDNGWGDSDGSRIGIGKFYDANFADDTDFNGEMYGVVAPAIVGTLLAGKQLIIESTKTDGNVLAFRVDSSGASLHNGTFTLYDAALGTGGRIGIDPVLGIYGGNNINMLHYNSVTGLVDGMMTTGGNVVTAIDDLTGTDEPKSNFWLDMNGEVYLKGTIYAEAGEFRGSLNIGGANAFRVDEQGNLSIGGTASNPNFYVSANGDMRAKTGTFEGTLEGATLKGTLEADQDTGGWIEGVGLKIGENSQITNGYNFYVDSSGNVSIGGSGSNPNFYIDSQGNMTAKGNINLSNGNLVLGSGSISWANLASDAQTEVTDAQSDAASALSTANSASSTASTASSNVRKLANGTYSGGTFISNKTIESPTITGGIIAGGEFTNLYKGAYLEIGGDESANNFGDLKLYRRTAGSTSKGTLVFQVYDEGTLGCYINVMNHAILYSYNDNYSSSSNPNVTYPRGIWDFNEVTVRNLSGVSATAVFG